MTYVVPGGGDDVVDATAYPGDSMETSLGQRQADGSSGDDIYLGGGQTDIVFVSAGVAADHKDIHLDGGEDELYVDSNYRGAATAKLGVGADHYWTERPRPGVRVNAEEGRDHFVSKCGGCRVLKVRLGTGAIEVNGSPAGAADRFEDVDRGPLRGQGDPERGDLRHPRAEPDDRDRVSGRSGTVSAATTRSSSAPTRATAAGGSPASRTASRATTA